jgi:hypothetical protein
VGEHDCADGEVLDRRMTSPRAAQTENAARGFSKGTRVIHSIFRPTLRKPYAHLSDFVIQDDNVESVPKMAEKSRETSPVKVPRVKSRILIFLTTVALLGSLFTARTAFAQSAATAEDASSRATGIAAVSAERREGTVGIFACASEVRRVESLDAIPGGVRLGVAMADFTGDSRPYRATVNLARFGPHSADYFIEIRLTEGGSQLLGLTAPPGGVVITPEDVTGDGTIDLVVRGAGSLEPVAIFINDGCGRFSRHDPASTSRSDAGGTTSLTSANAWQYQAACAISTSSPQVADLKDRSRRALRPAIRLAGGPRTLLLQFEQSPNSGRAPPSL